MPFLRTMQLFNATSTRPVFAQAPNISRHNDYRHRRRHSSARRPCSTERKPMPGRFIMLFRRQWREVAESWDDTLPPAHARLRVSLFLDIEDFLAGADLPPAYI